MFKLDVLEKLIENRGFDTPEDRDSIVNLATQVFNSGQVKCIIETADARAKLIIAKVLAGTIKTYTEQREATEEMKNFLSQFAEEVIEAYEAEKNDKKLGF